MKAKALLSLILTISISGCGFLGSSGPSSDYVTNGVVGAATGAGVGAAIGSAISNGDIANSALLGGGVGLAVGVVGTYAYKKIEIHNEIIDNDASIESNRKAILSKQAELDRARSDALLDSHDIEINKSKTEKIYDGATNGVYYR